MWSLLRCGVLVYAFVVPFVELGAAQTMSVAMFSRQICDIGDSLRPRGTVACYKSSSWEDELTHAAKDRPRHSAPPPVRRPIFGLFFVEDVVLTLALLLWSFGLANYQLLVLFV